MRISYASLTFLLLLLVNSCGQDGYAPGCNPCRIFVSATKSKGDFGSIAAADTICNSDANKPEEGYYKALLVSENGTRLACTSHRCQTGGDSEHVDWVLYPETTYLRATDEEVIGITNSYSIFDLPLDSPFSTTAGNAWTGFDLPGTEWMAPSRDSCDNWTSTASSSPPGGGTSSLNDGSNFNMAFAFGNNCSATNSFLCVEQ